MTDSEYRKWLKTATDIELKVASLELNKQGIFTYRANLAQAERNRRCGNSVYACNGKSPSYIHQDNDYNGGWT